MTENRLRSLLDLLFERYHIRYAVIDSVAWFVAKDVATALGIEWRSGETRGLQVVPDSWKLIVKIQDELTPRFWGVSSRRKSGQRAAQNVLCISEAGVFKLAFSSRKPAADRLVNWLAEEVLPSLLRYGCYPAPDSEAERFRVRFLRLRSDRGAAAAKAADELEASGLVTVKTFRELHRISTHDALTFANEVRRMARAAEEPTRRFYVDGAMRGAWTLTSLMRALINFQPRLPLLLNP